MPDEARNRLGGGGHGTLASSDAKFADDLTTVAIPWNSTMMAGCGYNSKTGKGVGLPLVRDGLKIVSTGAGAESNICVSSEVDIFQTQSTLAATLQLKSDGLFSSVSAGGSISTESLSESKSGSIAINYYTQTDFVRLNITRSSSSTDITDYSTIKEEFQQTQLDERKLSAFYRAYGSHLIIGWQRCYGVSLSADAQTSLDQQRSRLSAYADVSYGPFDAHAQMTQSSARLKQNKSLHLNVRILGAADGFPDLPTDPDEALSKEYLQQTLAWLEKALKADKAKADMRDSDPRSVDDQLKGSKVMALCVPWREIFTLAEDPSNPATDLQLQLLSAGYTCAGLVSTYVAIKRMGLPFLTDTQRQSLQTSINQNSDRQYQMEDWLQEISADPKKARDIQKQYNRLDNIPPADLPVIVALPNIYAWQDSFGIYASVAMPRGPFLLKTDAGSVDVNPPCHTPPASCPNGWRWYNRRIHGCSDVETISTVNVDVLIKPHGGQKLPGWYDVQLILSNDPSETPISRISVYNQIIASGPLWTSGGPVLETREKKHDA